MLLAYTFLGLKASGRRDWLVLKSRTLEQESRQTGHSSPAAQSLLIGSPDGPARPIKNRRR